MESSELRQKYLDFFKEKGHTIISPASLIPENDPTVLFTTAGMHPLVPFLLGEKHPGGKRLVDCQPCIRTDDIDEVGDSTHHTFFEMLGNWSLGDYFKEGAIKMSWEFLTSKKWLNLDKNRIAASVFAGDQDASFDQEAFDIWKGIFEENDIPVARIAKLPKKNNWWGPAGESGPCGPDTEMFYWTGKEKNIPQSFNDDNSLWVEIWNDVFMQYFKDLEGKFSILSQQNVDTGMGLERTLSAINGLGDDYKTDLFWPIIEEIEKLSGKKYDDYKKEFRIIADHIKAATFIIGDRRGVEPSNVKQGYVLRRLIRRAIIKGKTIGLPKIFLIILIEKVMEIYGDFYSELRDKKNYITDVVKKEEEKFEKTLEQGLKILNTQLVIREYIPGKEIKDIPDVSPIEGVPGFTPSDLTGKWLFNLYQTFGFPLELSLEEIEKMRSIDRLDLDRLKIEFKEELKEHQELSRTASAGMFKGGLADAGIQATKYHTATHLLLAALREVFGDNVFQRGSNITAERMRFDFSHPQKLTPEELKRVEEIVNQKIKDDLPVVCAEMGLDEAKQKGMMGIFENKYGEKVKTYAIGEFSKEICGGPHINKTSELGHFKIIKEEASSAGVRRIKAVLE
jgi:alanyl-tRNA synthetase